MNITEPLVEKDWVTKSNLRAACLKVSLRSGGWSYRCGYVEVPVGHPLFGKEIRRSLDVVLDCHGGLTYSGSGELGYPVFSEGWWFGFDCFHSGDGQIEPDALWPVGHPLFGKKISRSLDAVLNRGRARSQEYVVAECEGLARQIVEMYPTESNKDDVGWE